jgi:hypothetical protein
MINLEAIYHQGLASGNHVTGLEAVFQEGINAGVQIVRLATTTPQEVIAETAPVGIVIAPELQAKQAIT